MKSNKHFLQFVAALWILLFHLWIPVTGGGVENFILKIGYVGVDIFFFTSAYFLAGKDIRYPQLIANRFINIYLKFALFVLIAALYKDIQIGRALKQLLMIEFFEKGGGSFLWFLPAIFLFYLAYPLFVKWDSRYKTIIVLAVWLVLGLVLDKLLGYDKMFIFINRIPAMLAGYWLKKKPLPNWVLLPMLPVGIVLVYLCGYTNKLNVPFSEVYFAVGLVLALGIVGVSCYVPEGKVWHVLSVGTLELYGLQMVFGYRLVRVLYEWTGSAVLTNGLMVVILFTSAIILAKCYQWILARVRH